MWNFSQVGIALGALGLIVSLMGLFPGVTGAVTTAGIGLLQVVMVLTGYALLIVGALTYVKFAFYHDVAASLSQQIGARLALTGLLFAALSGLSDILGFGSHVRDDIVDIYFGQLQMVGILASFGISSLGVLIYAIAGQKHATTSPIEHLSNRISDLDDTQEIELGNLVEMP